MALSSDCYQSGSTTFLLTPDHYGVANDSLRSSNAGELISGAGCGSQHLSLSDKPHLRLNSATKRPNSEPPPSSSLPASDTSPAKEEDEKHSAFIVKQFAKFHLTSRRSSKRRRRRWRIPGSFVGNKKNQELIQKERTRLQLQQHKGGNVWKSDGLLRPSPLTKKVAELALRTRDSSQGVEVSDATAVGDCAAGAGKVISTTSLTCLRSSALSQNGLSQSLQDFSECCQELETFTIDESSRRGGGKKSPKMRKRTSKSQDDASRVGRESSATEAAKEKGDDDGGEEYNDISVDDLAGYLTEMVFPKKMSYMAEMMYT